jgi:4-amino-4-deoxy-L-arabinose transferase-like glycosyltransferase
MVLRRENDSVNAGPDEGVAQDAASHVSSAAGPRRPEDDDDVALPDEPSTFLKRLASLHEGVNRERLAFAFVMSVAAGVVLPFLGATGFFDPWETNYAEVARQMAQRDDYLYPFWKDAYFFSKPILLFWLTAPLYALVGAGHAERELPALVELAGRLPIALFALLMVAIVTVTARRLFGLRAAVLTGIALSTMPYFDFIARQAITDMLYVAPMSSAICLLALAFFDDEGREHMKTARLPRALVVLFALTVLPQMWEIGRTGAFLNRVTWLGSEQATRIFASAGLSTLAIAFFVVLALKARDPLLHAAAALLALATLGKGPHAVALTVLPFLIYFVATSEWNLLRRPAIVTSSLLYLVIASPWVIVMLLFPGKDDGQKTWFMRFVVYDLFGRLGGVHGERGTFEYYVRYLAYGMFPWAPLFPIALLDAAARKLKARRERTVEERFTLFVLIWAISYFTFFTVTETKFHHYIFPVVIPAAFLIGRWLDRLVAGRSRLPVGIGIVIVLATLVVGRDLASQPWQLVDLFSYHYVSYKPDYYFPPTPFFRVLLGGLALVVGLVLLVSLVSDRLYGRKSLHEEVTSSNDDRPLFLVRLDGMLGGPSMVGRIAFVVTLLIAGALFVASLLDVTANVEQLKPFRQRWVLRVFWFAAIGVALAVANLVNVIARSRSSAENFAENTPLTWPSRLGRALLVGGKSTTNGGFVVAICICAVISSVLLVQVYMANLSPHWSQRWLLKTYWSMAAPGEPLISYQMDWKGETFYSHNTEIQNKKDAAALKKAVDKPGREFILVQQDRFNRVKSAVSPSHAEHLRVVDRSNQKWFLVVAEEPPAKVEQKRTVDVPAAPEATTAPE